MRNKATVLGVVVVAAALALAAWLQPWETPTKEAAPLYSGTVIARVAGEPIYLEQAAFRAQGVQQSHETSKLGLGNNSPWPDLILQSLADDVIIRKEALKGGLVISPVEVAAETGGMVEMFGGSEQLGRYLASSGLTLPQFEWRTYMYLVGNASLEDVTEGVSVPETEVRAYFDKHRSQYPELNDAIAYATARPTIEALLEKEKRDATYSTWLKEQEAKPEYAITVLEDKWWKQIPTPTSQTQTDPATTATP